MSVYDLQVTHVCCGAPFRYVSSVGRHAPTRCRQWTPHARCILLHCNNQPYPRTTTKNSQAWYVALRIKDDNLFRATLTGDQSLFPRSRIANAATDNHKAVPCNPPFIRVPDTHDALKLASPAAPNKGDKRRAFYRQPRMQADAAVTPGACPSYAKT